MAEELKISYFEKNPRTCPVCNKEFYHEMLLTGGGRLIAGNLRDDLRRTYEKSKKYGTVYPLIYVVAVCPHCLYAAFQDEFSLIDNKKINEALDSYEQRSKYMHEFFGIDLDFKKNRDLISGAASYFLALDGYRYHTKDSAPTLKKALCSLRLSWTLEDLANVYPNNNYDKLIPFFQYKASEFYTEAIEYMQNGKESFDKLKSFGPDIDNNFGYEGMLYMGALLGTDAAKFIPDPNVKARTLVQAKRKISKIFGSGKSSKSKPSALLEKLKELHTRINEELAYLNENYGINVD
ncbi:DUF2225 domain-containing protein [Brachyspira pilosicoli]|uniref:DUF2225 domain-containing protein n=1 Tax=Brachyspira pilosicoli TaxID=52584 RepID=A0A5C8FBH1_BRAPL|nr:DUF2225 domain-containing protein [Brachyspira pilosicoli]TXJ46784.1 DUF2225 domain-containing protein [Brachyspira pilosicoli]